MNNNIEPIPEIEENEQFDYDDLLWYWQIIKQRYWLFITTFIIIVLSGTIYTFNKTPVYEASTTLLIEPDMEQTVYMNDNSRRHSDRFYETQIEIIKSRSVIKKTLDILNQSKNLGDEESSKTVKPFQERLKIETEKNTQLVKLSVSHTDPETATNEVNTWARTYIHHNLEDRIATSKDAFTWLSEQISVLKAKVKLSEMNLLKYKEEENIVSLEKRQTMLESRIAETNEAYIQVETDYMQLETMLTEIDNLKQSEFAESLPRILENTLIQELKRQYSTLEIELAKISKKYKPKHPNIISLQSQIDNIKKRLSIEIEKSVNSIEIEAHISKANVNAIERNLDNLKQKSMRLSKQAVQYGVLKREAESDRNMYDVLLHRLRETDINGSVTANNIRVLDTAIVPENPILPNIKLNMIITLALALCLGLGFCVVDDFFDNSIKTESDVELYLNESLLGIVPEITGTNDIMMNTNNQINRSYSEIKTNLSFYQQEHLLKTMLITSTDKGEGKSTSVYHLGRAFALSGYKVLLIDADMYIPQLSKMFKLKQKTGISDYFLHNKTADEIITKTETPKLFVMPMGLIPPNPSELMGSEKMKNLLENVKKDFDIVLVDSPPINATIGVAALGSYTDGVAVVVKAHGPSKKNVKKGIKNMKLLKGNIVGVILTSVKQSAKFSYNYGNENM